MKTRGSLMIGMARRLGGLSLVVALAGMPAAALAGTIVRISTSVGDFSIELLDETAPNTVANFLSYVNDGDYNQTYFHRVEAAFVAQAGGYRFQPYVGPIDVPEDPPVANEFSVSNTRGTIAMAKLDNQPDSATSQWFVNLVDNPSLDSSNGGFTVFGTVLGNGMTVLDLIDSLPTISLGTKASRAPFITDSYESPLNFIYMNMEVVDRFSSALHVYEAARKLLLLSVNVNGGTEAYSVNLSLVEDGSDIVLEVNPDSVIALRSVPSGAATFSTGDNRLRIPVLEVNYGNSVGLVYNVVFRRNSPVDLRFVLESFQESP